ncbi:hypothetical protein GCM10009867_34960 [Pedococcus aerophilus]|uniref:Putative Flp pilus-assembly TadG-like N-terminal domain-containing protein n=1 Tax=Pedococcus aerophilus TaxID=436356 RepID=A0ABP6HEH0_9MICO
MTAVQRARRAHLRLVARRGSAETGYVAVLVGLLLTVLLGCCAFAVDVGNWYYTGQRAQRAADAAALAAVPYLPGDPTTAYGVARTLASQNGFAASADTVVVPVVGSKSTRMRVDVSRTVKNNFGWLLGLPTTTVGRSAVADYAGPVPMGSPCNEFGDDPDPGSRRSTNCDGTAQFWANVGSPQAAKSYGDAYQNQMGTNADYDVNGYYYTVTVTKPTTNLTFEAFDPALIAVGDRCDTNLTGASSLHQGSNTVVVDPDVRYASGPSSKYCTGDVRFGGTGEVQTEFSIREASATTNQWDPTSYAARAGCTTRFAGFNGDLSVALDRKNAGFRADVADNFRQWVQLCRINGVTQPGTYLIQVKTNQVGNDQASGHNRFSLRAWGTNNKAEDGISVAGFGKMAMYGNTPAGTSKFFLARVPSGSRGQLFRVRLYDIGDGTTGNSTIKVLPPTESGGGFTGCIGSGIQNGTLSDCTINVSSAFNGQWQDVTIPLPATYSCTDSSPTGCWLRLEFFYGSGSQPADTTSWTASIAGDPVRLVQ